MRTIIFPLGLILLMLLACNSETISPIRLLVKEIGDPTYYMESFTYQEGQLFTFKRLCGNNEGTSIKFLYSDNRLIKIENRRDQELESFIELEYNANGQRSQEKLTMIYNGDTTYIRTGTFTYSNGKLKSLKYNYNKPDYSTEEREFQWDKGNLIRIDFYYYANDMRFSSISRLYEYDNKLNYSNQDIGFIYTIGTGDETMASKNNLVTMQQILDTDVSQGGQYSFKYDSNGYPISYIYRDGEQQSTPRQFRYY